MNDYFKGMIEEQFYQQIFDTLEDEIMNNYSEYDLTLRARDVIEVLEATLDNIEILRVNNIKQDDEEVSFDILVNCDIEIGDYFAKENISESIRQWFKLSCSAVLDNASLSDFVINDIEAYNK
ncbi:MAG TPA: hypothetical protein DEF39_04355 [Hungateiclostridium thermocellum]|uniref:Uncharacterized protein n=1 Tax=Acetivibrio thermocellus (strain ATCC 27405 / DSM 1237 / JCM 9322 / NBRC 103400 / NCIMB 10682 / NRRL B-4536 / VPI 7372) TaxID=203119 RepID=A3DG86_ACET2|nr:hypothetical protein [Acetivibrio thermocellus]ABN52965.1 hypothetical protein Cthe_1744 [Acetivibrio thermocellus ATCC 27405]HBW26495.1 hypothetical protein [Acetivibrio thermocellus]